MIATRKETRKALSKGIKAPEFGIFYTDKNIVSAFVEVDKSSQGGVNVEETSNWENCREIASEALASELTDTGACSCGCCDYIKVYLDFTSIALNSVNYENMVKGLRVINYFEKVAGFNPTFIKPIGYYPKSAKTASPEPNTVYVCGPKEWQQGVPFFSLYLMLLKTVSFVEIKPKEKARTYLKRAAETVKEKKFTPDCLFQLNILLKHHQDIITIVMRNFNKLKDSLDYGTPNPYVEELGVEGINRLTYLANTNTEIYPSMIGCQSSNTKFVLTLGKLLDEYKGKRCL